jgi:PAS domain S-box-containing protein
MNRMGLDLIEAESFDEVHGKCVYPLVSEEHREAFRAMVQEVFKGRSQTFEFMMIGFKGRPLWLYTHAVPLRNERGDIVTALATTIDITERKTAEEKLRKSEARLKKAEALGSMGYWEWNILTNELIWSDEVFGIYGLDPLKDKPRYEIVLQTVAPECRDRFVKAVEDAVRIGVPFDGEYRMIGLDGRERFTHTTGEVTRDHEGKPISMFGIVQDITTRKRAAAALLDSEERFKNLYSQAPIGIELYDADGILLDVNPACMKIFGITSPDAVKGFSLFDDPNVPPDVKERLRRGESVSYEAIFDFDVVRAKRLYETNRFGKCVLECFISTWNFASDDLTGYLVHVTDITKRKRREEALRESEERYRKLFEISVSPILVIDSNGNYIDCNTAAVKFLESTRDEILRKNVVDYIPPGKKGEVLTTHASLWESGGILETEYYINGRVKLMELSINRTVWKGAPVAFAIGNDITERKRAEERIRQNEQFIRDILDTVDEGFIVIDRDYRIMTANKAYCGQVGGTGDTIIGRHCYEISHKRNHACHEAGEECAARRVFETGEPGAALHKHPDSDGHILYVETKAYPIKDASGNVTSVIETVNNITERHLLEEERLKTQKLESIGTLAGGIAHDFNNLLQGIFGYISMAKLTHDQKEKSLAMLEQAEKALHQSVNLTTQLLTFSKGGRPAKKRMSLLPMIENAARFALSGSRSECRIDCDPGLWQVEADEGQLGQVIQNIVLNADQAMPLGGSIVITVRNISATDAQRPRSLGARNHVLIAIRDSGVGISEQYLTKIFDPYFTTKEKGSGLGLATSYSIIKNHDGLIEVTSQVGKGSTFLVHLPAIEAVPEHERKEAAPAPTRSGRILVMDDEKVVRDVAGELLRILGHEVEFAENGEAALAMYREAMASSRPFDIIIMDLTIRGGMGGLETVGKLLEADPTAKAIVSSGYSDDSTLSNYHAQGFKDFLQKPYNMEELRATLSTLLG